MAKNMRLEIGSDGLKLGGEDFYLACGELHYFRVLPEGWKRRLELMKDFGLTAVQTYVPWHLHEKYKGEFNFEGYLDLGAFLKLCDEIEMKVMLRPSPYITSEVDLGGIPGWVQEKSETYVRCRDPYYLECISEYNKKLCKEFVPYLSTNGGPVIAVVIENEYGSYSNDQKYLEFLRDSYVENGVDVPFFTTDGGKSFCNGNLKGSWAMVNCGADVEPNINSLREYQPDKPAAIGEFWCGRNMAWGAPFGTCKEDIADAYKKALDMGAYVSFYMFCGGTNFGFTSGLHYGRPYGVDPQKPLYFHAYSTSYDCDALVSEWGDTTPKYYACRQVLDAYLGKPVRAYTIPDMPKQSISNVKLAAKAELMEHIDEVSGKSVESITLRTMESMGQSFGYILYSTFVQGTGSEAEIELFINGLKDLAMIFVDGKYVGSYLRKQGETGLIKIKKPANGCKLDILVENLGRPDAHKDVKERKGILDSVILRSCNLFDWKITSLPMDDISEIRWQDNTCPEKSESAAEEISTVTCGEKIGKPTFYRGTFAAKPGVDTFFHAANLTKGCVWINGFNIGRYWNIGPQQTLYVPGELLKEENEIVIFEMFNGADTVEFVDAPNLCEVREDTAFFAEVDCMQ